MLGLDQTFNVAREQPHVPNPNTDASSHLWVPAHTGIAGNEKADIAAKESTGWRTQTKRNGRQIGINTDKTAYQIWVLSLKAAIRATHRQQIYESWKTSWNNEVKGKGLRVLVPQN